MRLETFKRMAQEGRSVLALIVKNFIQSLKPRRFRGTKVGKDYFGNMYYEIPADPQGGRRKRARWFEPKNSEDFDQELPAEWEAWLRGRRKEPPTEEELLQNLALMQQKKEGAKAIEEEFQTKDKSVMQKNVKGMESFPKYEEYEIMPGKSNPSQKSES